MTVYVWTDSDGRVGAVTDDVRFSYGATAVEYPDVPEDETIFDYVLRDGALVYDPLPEPDPAPDPVAIATEARQLAEEAKQAASEAGTDPQLQALATMQVATMDLTEATSTDCVGFRDYWPEWQPGTGYKYQQPLRHKGLYYRASKALTSSSIYPPDTAGESEYYPIELAEDGVIVYRECHGEYDQVQAGETRHYPDAEGPVYRAKVDTAYDPDTVPGNWELV